MEVPCPWRIHHHARVELHWWSRPSKNGTAFGKLAFPFQKRLLESESDEIVLYENGVDTRKFFKIDVGDRLEWVKAEQEKIDSKYKDKVNTLRRLGMKKIDFKSS